MSIKDWLTIAKKLPVDGSTRITCCNQNQTAIISHSSKWYRVHCFRCGFTAAQKKESLTLHELAKMNEAEGKYKTWSFPSDATREFPQSERVWLMENNVDLQIAGGIHYSPSLKRIIIPAYADWNGVATGTQARSLKSKPKYLTSGNASVSCHTWGTGTTSTLVLTEDILSARHVANYRVSAIALVGTSLTDAAIRAIIKYPYEVNRIFVWMDPDEPGQNAAKKIIRRIKDLGLTSAAYNILSSKDPKKCTTDEIKANLYGD